MRRMAWMFAFLLVTGVGACGGDDDQSGNADGGQHAAVGLENALLATAEASGYRITQSIGQMISFSAIGLDTELPIDEEDPTVVGEVTPEANHYRVDLSTVFRPLLGDDAPPPGFEIWTGPDRMVIDTREYSAITEHNPRADLARSSLVCRSSTSRPFAARAPTYWQPWWAREGWPTPGSWPTASPRPSMA